MAQRRAQGYVRWIVLAVLLGGGVVAGYAGFVAIRPVVTVTEPAERRVVQAFYATGTVSPEREYPIRTPAAGLLADVFVDKGDAVKQGQPLAFVSDPDLVAKVRQAEAEVAEKLARADAKTSPVIQEFDSKIRFTKEMVEIADREQKRLRGLIESSAGTQTDVDRALDRLKLISMELATWQSQRGAKLLELRKDVDVARATLDAAKENAKRQTLVSPIDGVVLDRPISRGTRLAVNDHVMRVADVRPGKLVMRAAVDEEDVVKVRVDPDDPQVVLMTLYAFTARPGERADDTDEAQQEREPFQGKVLRKYDQADPDRRTFEVDVSLPEGETRFQPGMTGELAFVMREKESATVVPRQAVQDGGLFVVRDRRLARAEGVRLGVSGVERVEVLAGLRPGDRVVISPVAELTLGQWVRETYTDPDAAAGLNKPKEKEIFRGGF